MVVIVHQINYKVVVNWVNAVWAKSLAAVVMFFIGLWIGGINAEYRVVSDCKFAGAFRVDIQAFNCQRRI